MATIIDLAIVLLAWLVSLFLFVAVLAILGALDPTQVGAAGLDPLALSSREIALGFFGAGILFAIGGFYHVYAWSRLGATPGQQLLKMAGDPRGAAALGLQFGADVVIMGEVVAKPSARRIA